MPDALLGGEPPQVLILTPFWVLDNVQFVTKILLTSSSFSYLPRLPILLKKKPTK